MDHPPHNRFRILAVAPCTKGFGFAVLEADGSLVDWGLRTVRGEKNSGCLAKILEMAARYRPEAIALEDTERGSRRSERIRALNRKIEALAVKLGMRFGAVARDEIHRALLADGEGTRHEVAESLAKRFPEELGPRLPPKRKPWKSEDSRMSIFDAVASGVTFRKRQVSRDG